MHGLRTDAFAARSTKGPERRAMAILGADSGAGLMVGAVLLALRIPFAELYGVPVQLLTATAAVNVLYGSYSGVLWTRARRGRWPGRRSIDALVAANASWGVVCLVLAVATWRTASVFGTAQWLAEGAFVFTLAALERCFVRTLCDA